MSLPSSYSEPQKYIEDVLAFLKEYQWIYNYPNTDILINKVFNEFPSNWVSYFAEIGNTELNQLAFGIVNKSCPDDLKQFFDDVNALRPVFSSSDDNTILSLPNYCRLSAKKAHEICCLAPVIKNVCDTHNISTVVDVGSGLGYLSHLLYSKYNFKVLGIEGCREKYEIAVKNQEKQHPESIGNVKYADHFITAKSVDKIRSKLEENFGVCIAGLHACADLSVDILDVFLELDAAKTLVIMPCCYHRLKLKEADETGAELFYNFPISSKTKAVYAKLNGERFMRRPFFRNACQRTNQSWKEMSESDHRLHAKNCLFRAILQKVAVTDNFTVSRKKRKTGKSSEGYCIGDFIETLTTSFLFTSNVDHTSDVNIEKVKADILLEWEQNKQQSFLIEVLAAFQTAIQSICENVLLLDRVEYLQEQGAECRILKVTDDGISPRCLALVANKN